MKNTKLTALEITLLIFMFELFNMLVLDYAALPRLSEALLDGAVIALMALFIMRRYINRISRAQSRFSGFVAQIPDNVIITGPDGKITYVNPAFERATGYMLGEVVGKTPNILRSGKHESSFYREIWLTLKGGRTWRGRIINKKKDGALYTEDAVIFPVMDEEGNLAEFVGIWKDITDKLLAEEKTLKYLQTIEITNSLLKLSLENRTLPEIMQAALDLILSAGWLSIERRGAVFLTDKKTNLLKMAAHTGLSEAIIKSCAEVPAGRCLCGKALLSGRPVFKSCLDGDHETVYEGMHAHGHYIIQMAVGDAVYGVINVYTRSGQAGSDFDIEFLSAVASILAGIIHRKNLNERLFLLKEMQNVANAADTKATLKLLIENLCEITGWPMGEVWMPDTDRLYLDKTADYCVAEHELEAFAEQSCNFRFKKGEGLPGRVWESKESAWVPDVTEDPNFPRKDATASCGIKAGYAVPLLVNGEVVAVLSFFTTKVRNEDKDLTCFLDAAVGQISAAFQKSLLSEQLLQAQKMDIVGKLAGGIAHDFNNILGAILGYADFLIKDLGNMPRQAADALEVRKAAERATALTRQLLTFSRKKAAVRRILDLNAAVKGLLPMLGRITGENIILGFTHTEAALWIKIDPIHLEQVVINLVVNARDAMPGGGAITIRAEELRFAAGSAPAGLGTGKYAVLSVSDTGVGMSEEIKRRIFEPFFSTKPEGKGTGLGLSIVYGVIRQNNARITVDSVPDKGATFKVYIPAAGEKETAAAPESRGEGVCPGGTETILIAEDDEMFRAVLLRVLKEHGYNALAVPDVAGALSLANAYTGEIHLLLTDIRMPGKNGAELAEELLRSRPGIRLLYMTGYHDADVLDRHRLNDAVLLRKPIESPRLLAKVREILDIQG